MAAVITNDPGEMPDPSDFSAYESWRDAGGTVGGPDTGNEDSEFVPPATGEGEELPSEAGDEDAAAVGEGEEPAEGEGEDVGTDETDAESEPVEQEVAPAKTSESKIDKRFRKMTNRIAELTRELQEVRGSSTAVEDENEGEESAVTTAPATVQDETPLVAPKLSDFATFEDWQTANEAYQDAKTDRKVKAAKAEAVHEKEQEIAQVAHQAHQAEWDRNATRFADYNEIVTDDIKISQAMAVAMHADTEKGTRIAYYLGKHPEVALAIAQQTLVSSPKQWPAAVARAGVLLGEISAKLENPAPKASTTPRPKTAAVTPPPGTKTATKIATAASRPPVPLRGQPVPSGKVSTTDPQLASDYRKWEKAREKEIAANRR